jgi:hypothetical protein
VAIFHFPGVIAYAILSRKGVKVFIDTNFVCIEKLLYITIKLLHYDPPLDPRPYRAGNNHERKGISPSSSGASTQKQPDPASHTKNKNRTKPE